jgi:hypothetical protein
MSESRIGMLKEGLVTEIELIDLNEQINRVKLSIGKSRNELKKISIKSFDLSYKGDEDLLQIRQKIETQNQNVFSLEKKLDRSTNIVSPYTGTVLETKVGI